MKYQSIITSVRNVCIVLFMLFSFNMQAGVNSPLGGSDEVGKQSDQLLSILVVNIETKEVVNFENMTLTNVLNSLTNGNYKLTIYKNNKKETFSYTKN